MDGVMMGVMERGWEGDMDWDRKEFRYLAWGSGAFSLALGAI